MDKNHKLILEGNLWKVMFKLSWPAVLAMVLYGLNTLFDAIFVGKFAGEVALSGVSVAYPLTTVMQGLGSLIGVGAGSLLSLSIGRKDVDVQGRVIGNVNFMAVVYSLLFTLIALLFGENFVYFIGGRGEALSLGAEYFKITAVGSFLWIHGLAGNMIIRSEGRMKTAAALMAVGLVTNIVFNTIFVAFMGLGVQGAAWGTNIGMLSYFLTGVYYFSQGKASFKCSFFTLYYNKEIVKKIFSLGMPSLIMSVMSLVQGVVVFNSLSRYGTSYDIAFYGAVFRLMTLLLTPLFGLMRALQPVVGINYGARQNHRVIQGFKVFMLAGMIMVVPFWLFMMLLPETSLGLMLNSPFTNQNLINFRYMIAIFPLFPIVFMSLTFFPGIEKSKPAGLLAIVRQVVLYIPVMLILPGFLGIDAIYYGSLLIEIVVLLLCIYLVMKEFKVLKSRIA